MSVILITVGLILDILGAGLIFYFGVVPANRVDQDGRHNVVAGATSPEDQDKIKYKKYLSRTGLIFLIVGFMFQLLGLHT